MFKAHRLFYHATLGLRVIKKRREEKDLLAGGVGAEPAAVRAREPGHLGEGLGFRGWKREFKLPWREAAPPNYHDDKVGSDQ